MSHPTAIHILARISSVHRSLRFVYSFHMFKGSWTYSSGNSHSVWLGWCRRSTTTRKPQVDIWARATQQQLPKEIGNRRRIETEEDSSSWSWFFTAAALTATHNVFSSPGPGHLFLRVRHLNGKNLEFLCGGGCIICLVGPSAGAGLVSSSVSASRVNIWSAYLWGKSRTCLRRFASHFGVAAGQQPTCACQSVSQSVNVLMDHLLATLNNILCKISAGFGRFTTLNVSAPAASFVGWGWGVRSPQFVMSNFVFYKLTYRPLPNANYWVPHEHGNWGTMYMLQLPAKTRFAFHSFITSPASFQGQRWHLFFIGTYFASSPSTFCLLFIRKPATYRPTTRTCLCNLQRPRNQPPHMLLVFRPESASRCNAHHSYTILITSTSIILLSAVLRCRRGSTPIPAVYPNHVCVLFVSYPEGQAGYSKSEVHDYVGMKRAVCTLHSSIEWTNKDAGSGMIMKLPRGRGRWGGGAEQ